MYSPGAALFLYAETRLHAGSGASVGPADLPIQRERTTNHPIVQSTGLKGALRAWFEDSQLPPESRARLRELRKKRAGGTQEGGHAALSPEEVRDLEELERKERRVFAIFGPPPSRASDFAGSLGVTEARVLLFPVRALYQPFAWITCPHVLYRFRRDLALAGVAVDWDPPGIVKDDHCLLGQVCTLASPSTPTAGPATQRKVVLEEYTFVEQSTDAAARSRVGRIAQWLATNALPTSSQYWKDRLYKKEEQEIADCGLVILSDRDFRDFTELATETITRIRIDTETGTVERGGLWTEEHLPSETLLYSTLLPAEPRSPDDQDKLDGARGVLDALTGAIHPAGRDLMQIGGDETVGVGFVRMRFYSNGAREKREKRHGP